MSLRIPKQQRSFLPWIVMLVLALFITLIGAVSWHGYRWYVYGDPLPIDLPALASSGQPRPDETEVTAQQVKAHTVKPHEPRYLTIDSLGITSARIFTAEADNQTGVVKLPIHIGDASWFKDSAAPGDGGVTLLTGHTSGPTLDGLFVKLSSVQTGANIEVKRGDGERFTYVVRDISRVPLEDMQTTGVKRMTSPVEPGKETLILTARDGVWVPRYKQYSHRLIVRALLAE